MSELSPYAPTRVPDEAVPPRSGGKPAVFLWAIFAVGLTGTALWTPFLRELVEDNRDLAMYAGVSRFTGPLIFLFAFLCDRVPLFGTRRYGFLAVAAALGAAVWGAAALLPRSLGTWLGVSVALSVAVGMASVASTGALVELGQRQGLAGRLAAVRSGIVLAAGLLGGSAEEILASRSVGWTAGLGIGAMLSVLVMVALAWDAADDPAVPEPPAADYRRPQAFWAAFLVVLLAGVTHNIENLRLYTLLREHGEDAATLYDRLNFTKNLFELLAVGIYLALARRFALGALLRLSLGAQALGLLALLVVLDWPQAAISVRGIGAGLTAIAIAHLAIVSARPTREALSFVLITMLPRLLGIPLGTALLVEGSASVAFTVAAGVSFIAILAVSLVPAPLRAARDR